jgi:hypothetical protein
MKYCDGEKRKGCVPAWPVHLIRFRSPIDDGMRWLILKDLTPLYAVVGAGETGWFDDRVEIERPRNGLVRRQVGKGHQPQLTKRDSRTLASVG